MKRFACVCMMSVALVASMGMSGMSVGAQEAATPQQIIEKTAQAVDFLSKAGQEGLESFNQPGEPWVWRDTYIFVYNCEKGTIEAHPIRPQLIGKELMGLKDIKGNFFFVQLCEAARSPQGGWVEYWWPKPGEKEPSRKISLMRQVPGTPYQLGAGIYDDGASIEELNGMLK